MKAYLVLDLAIKDFAGFRDYIAAIPAHIARHDGRYIVRGAEPTCIEGDWRPQRIVIIEFPQTVKSRGVSERSEHPRPVQGSTRNNDKQARAR